MNYLSLEISDSIGYLTINRSEKRNAFNQQMWRYFPKLLADAAAANVRCLILKADGNKAFCAGADIDELTVMIKDKAELKVNNQYIQEAQQALATLPIATIALINGACMGGGLGLAMACDFRIAASHAKFAITPAKLGLMYSVVDTKRVYELVGLSRAKELLMLSKTLDAATAVEYGLINQQCELEQLTACGQELCQQVLANSSYSQRGMKLTLNHLSGEQEVAEQQLDDMFKAAFDGEDFAEGAAAFLQKRKPKFNQ